MNDRSYARFVDHVETTFRFARLKSPSEVDKILLKWRNLATIEVQRDTFAKELMNLYAWFSHEQLEEFEHRSHLVGIDVTEKSSFEECELVLEELRLVLRDRSEPEETPL